MTPEKLLEILSKYARSQGIFLNRNTAYVMDMLNGLLTNEGRYGYRSCPCRLAAADKEIDADIICPCAYRDRDIEEFGSCYCGLYVSGDCYEGKQEAVTVPERRPPDRRPF